MSHKVTVKTQLKSVKAIQAAAKAIGVECQIGQFSESFFESGRKAAGNVKLKLPNWYYPVIINTQTGEAQFDNYNGGWGDIKHFENLQQQYSVAVAMEEANEFALQGWDIQQVVQANGDIQIVMEK